MIRRTAMRALLMDVRRRELLLIKALVPDTGAQLWFTPGGGKEGEEPDLECLAREVLEETGLAPLPKAHPVWTRSEQFVFMEQHYHQDELYFLVPIQRFEVVEQALEAHEEETFLAARWWGIDEICASIDTFVPANLGELLLELLASYEAGRLPANTRHVGR